MRWIAPALTLLMVGCSPLLGVSGAAGLAAMGLLASVALGLAFGRARAEPSASATSAASGAPLPPPVCDGFEHASCADGRIAVSCCPKGAKCNYRNEPYQDCGDGACVPGNDPGLCPPKQPQVDPGKTAAECPGGWIKACVDRKVTMACLMPVPTNYMGPALNPPFRECGDDRCTTSRYVEDCYPAKGTPAASSVCLTGWTDVCLMGVLSQRCLPLGAPKSDASQRFVRCADAPGRCAIGDDQGACRRP